jgi:hypothetical protein
MGQQYISHVVAHGLSIGRLYSFFESRLLPSTKIKGKGEETQVLVSSIEAAYLTLSFYFTGIPGKHTLQKRNNNLSVALIHQPILPNEPTSTHLL